MLQGTVVPRWVVVEAVFLALCELADQDPDGARWDEEESRSFNDSPGPSYREAIKRAWNDASQQPSRSCTGH